MLRFRFLSCLPLILVVSACYSAAKPVAKPTPAPAIPKVVRAQAFELTDAAGKTRAWLGVSDDGTTVLKLLDADGKPKVLVDSNGSMAILDAEGKSRVTAGVMNGGYGIGLFDSKGILRAEAKVSQTDNPSLSVRDSAGKTRGILIAVQDDPVFYLSDGKEDGARLALELDDSRPELSLWDASGNPRASYSLLDGGFPLLQMTDADGKVLAEMAAGKDQPTLILQDHKSKMAAFLGFTADTDLSLLLQNGQSKTQIGLLLYGADPTLAIAHENGNPAASMRIGDGGVPYVRTSDKDNVTIWESP